MKRGLRQVLDERAERATRSVQTLRYNPAHVTLAAGTRLGPYEVLGPLGAGGMGEVYRARDTSLGRDVAVKILPQAFALDSERRARFDREARTLAALNHPHIAQIYGFEGGALVMELVEGEDLSRRIARGPVPVAEALRIARQIADALDAAHQQGIIHRDLKPANIKVRHDGTIKVLDFGLAKSAPSPDAPLATTASISITAEGSIVGTVGYMAPEQIKGAPPDRRADIWAFGCVLFEMLSGRPAFAGGTSVEVLARIVEREPEWEALPPSVPSHITWLLRRCLEKDPKRRLRDIGDAQPELEMDARGFVPAAQSSRLALPIAVLITAVVVAAMVIAINDRPDDGSWEVLSRDAATFAIGIGSPPPPGSPGLAVSNDGRHIAGLRTTPEGRSRLWTYAVATGDMREFPVADGAAHPFWSPDASSLGYISPTDLRILDLGSGTTRKLADLPGVSNGASWGAQGVIVFSARYALYQIPAAGGTPTVVAQLNPAFHENSLRHPRFLPDGRRFLYVARSGRDGESGAYVGSLDATPVRLFPVMSQVVYAPPGYLLHVDGGALVARTFDPVRLTAGSRTDVVVPIVGAGAGGMMAHFDASANGTLAYFKESAQIRSTLQWVDRSGRPVGAPSARSLHTTYSVAPDGDRVLVALAGDHQVGRDVWLMTAGLAAVTRLTFDGSDNWSPFWFPDGRSIGFMSYRNGVGDIYVKPLDGSAAEKPLLVSDDQKQPGNMSGDGKYLAYWSDRADTLGDVWVAPVDGSAAPVPIAVTRFDERAPRLSPDGRFIAYESNESGTREIYVQPFPTTSGKWQVSVKGGSAARWGKGGRELFYLDGDGMLHSVPVRVSPIGFSAGASAALFRVPNMGAGASRYDPSPDGQRFLVNQPIERAAQPVVVVLNWPARLKR